MPGKAPATATVAGAENAPPRLIVMKVVDWPATVHGTTTLITCRSAYSMGAGCSPNRTETPAVDFSKTWLDPIFVSVSFAGPMSCPNRVTISPGATVPAPLYPAAFTTPSAGRNGAVGSDPLNRSRRLAMNLCSPGLAIEQFGHFRPRSSRPLAHCQLPAANTHAPLLAWYIVDAKNGPHLPSE